MKKYVEPETESTQVKLAIGVCSGNGGDTGGGGSAPARQIARGRGL